MGYRILGPVGLVLGKPFRLEDIQGVPSRSPLNYGPFQDPFCKGAVVFWGPKKGPECRELPIWTTILVNLGSEDMTSHEQILGLADMPVVSLVHAASRAEC